MWETTSSFTRLAALALVTGSFAAAWSDDHQAQTAYALARQEAHQQPIQAESVLSDTTGCCRSRDCVVAHRANSQRVMVEVDMALPKAITPGRFRVVDTSGRMFTIAISEESADAHLAPRDLYLLDLEGGGRRSFIRIGAVEPSQAIATDDVTRRPRR